MLMFMVFDAGSAAIFRENALAICKDLDDEQNRFGVIETSYEKLCSSI